MGQLMHKPKTFTDIPAVLTDDSDSSAADFCALYRENVLPVFYYLYSRVHNVADAEDLTSQTFMTVFENHSRLRDPLKYTSWVFTIARNKAFDYFRKTRRHPATDYDERLDTQKTEGGGLSQTDQDRLRDLEHLISCLNPHEQEYLRLRIVADLPFAVIATILKEPETRIKKQYYRLLARLQAQVEK
jgi:RNA polymerase sigma-70 factor (ECF subfamily)